MTFKIFGYLIGFEKWSTNHNRTFQSPVCKIVSDGTHFLLAMPNGEIVPKQLHCTIIERINEPPRARIELFVDVSDLLKAKQNDSQPPHGDNKTE